MDLCANVNVISNNKVKSKKEVDTCNDKVPILLIGSMYRHPGANIEEFTKQLDDLINRLQNRYQLYILGDMNIDFLKYNSHSQTEKCLTLSIRGNLSPSQFSLHYSNKMMHLVMRIKDFIR